MIDLRPVGYVVGLLVAALGAAMLVPLMIDVADPEAADLVSAYRIGTTPITLVTDARGEVLQYHVGGMSRADFVGFLDQLEGKTSPVSNPH